MCYLRQERSCEEGNPLGEGEVRGVSGSRGNLLHTQALQFQGAALLPKMRIVGRDALQKARIPLPGLAEPNGEVCAALASERTQTPWAVPVAR